MVQKEWGKWGNRRNPSEGLVVTIVEMRARRRWSEGRAEGERKCGARCPLHKAFKCAALGDARRGHGPGGGRDGSGGVGSGLRGPAIEGWGEQAVNSVPDE
jgi:hypothetical protein